MAMKRRITAEEFAKLAVHFQGEYLKKGDDYFLDADENDDAKELRAAKEREKTDRLNAQREAKDLAKRIETLTEQLEDLKSEGENSKKTEVEKLVLKHEKELARVQKEATDKLGTVNGQLQKLVIDDQAEKLGAELFRFTPDIFANQLIKPRMKLVDKDGIPKAVAVDSQGNEMELAQLRAELLANASLADILKPASQASGGGANHGQGGGSGGGGAKTLTEQHQELARQQGLIR